MQGRGGKSSICVVRNPHLLVWKGTRRAPGSLRLCGAGGSQAGGAGPPQSTASGVQMPSSQARRSHPCGRPFISGRGVCFRHSAALLLTCVFTAPTCGDALVCQAPNLSLESERKQQSSCRPAACAPKAGEGLAGCGLSGRKRRKDRQSRGAAGAAGRPWVQEPGE